MQNACWAYSGERQIERIRKAYITAILRQDITWFDKNNPGELSSKVAEATVALNEGMGRKVGDFISFSFQFIGSLGVAFYFSWKLALVVLCGLPLIATFGMYASILLQVIIGNIQLNILNNYYIFHSSINN